MSPCPQNGLLQLATLFLALIVGNSHVLPYENRVKTSVYLSPKFVLEQGSVSNQVYRDVDFPRGHIAIKSFNAEVVDEAGNSVPLLETYLHHWVLDRYYQREGVKFPYHSGNHAFHRPDHISAGNAGICDNNALGQFFGLGSETRRTATYVPDPFGIVVGNPEEIPAGYEEKWQLNVHAIDTRGTEDRLGCTECRCDLYNVTDDEYGRPLKPDYVGGLNCCYDKTQCRVREGVESVEKILYMKYTVKWVEWDDSIVPVKIYIFDVTDTWKKFDESTGKLGTRHDCKVEYDIESCDTGLASNGCIDTKRVRLSLPANGDLVYGVAHQHTGGIGSALYGEDGRVICSSLAIYGEGNEAGNEAGYIVGMSTCYPRPGSVKISGGELLTLESNYSSKNGHTGVMGLFYLLVAEPSSKSAQMHEKIAIPKYVWVGALFGVAIAVAAAVVAVYKRTSQREGGYQSLMI